MSCLPEQTYAAYVDGELAPGQTRPVEAHLVGCRRCRALVIALREESELLSDVLRERAPRALPAASPAPPRGPAFGLGPALAVTFAATLALGWVLERGLPAGLDWLNPFSLGGALRMAFDLVFVLRDRAPAAFELVVAIAGMASASAVLTLALSLLLRRMGGAGTSLICGLALLSWPQASSAHFGWHEHRDFTLPAGEVHEGTLVVSGRSVNIDGLVTGDVVVLSERLTVRGEVRGNLFGVAQTIELPGELHGSAYIAGEQANVSGDVRGDLYAAQEHFTLARGGAIARDATLLASSGVFEGSGGRDLFLFGDWMELRGHVSRDVRAHVRQLALRDGARIEGSLRAVLPPGEAIDAAPGAVVVGETVVDFHGYGSRRRLQELRDAHTYVWMALHVGAALLFGLLLHGVEPRLFDLRLDSAQSFFRSLLVGLAAALGIPIALGVVAITVVGIPTALVGLAAYLTSLYVGLIVVAGLIGAALVRRDRHGRRGFAATLAVGLLVLVVATHLPFVGGLIRILAVLTGLGLLADRGLAALRPRAAFGT